MHFSDLRIYKISVDLSVDIDKLAKTLPKHLYREVDQIKRSADSIPANIAEGFGKKMYPKDFIRFLNIALGSSDETQSHTISLHSKGYISKELYEYLFKGYKNLSIKILNLIKAIDKKVKKI